MSRLGEQSSPATNVLSRVVKGVLVVVAVVAAVLGAVAIDRHWQSVEISRSLPSLDVSADALNTRNAEARASLLEEMHKLYLQIQGNADAVQAEQLRAQAAEAVNTQTLNDNAAAVAAAAQTLQQAQLTAGTLSTAIDAEENRAEGAEAALRTRIEAVERTRECRAGTIRISDTECQICAENEFQSGNVCVPCPDGQTSAEGSTQCA